MPIDPHGMGRCRERHYLRADKHNLIAPLEILQPERIPPQWFHPYLLRGGDRDCLASGDLQALAYDFFLRFMRYFRDQPEGQMRHGVAIEFTRKMRQRLGMAVLGEGKIRLNHDYFSMRPAGLPYTLFHEMVHMWLYDCDLDPGHTRRFYQKMMSFLETGLPVDPEVYVHRRLAPEAKFVYRCPGCQQRWYTRDRSAERLYCGYCFENSAQRHYPTLIRMNGDSR